MWDYLSVAVRAALCVFLIAVAPVAQAERVCVEEAAGVCLKYRDVTPEPPKPAPAKPAAPARVQSPEAAEEAALRLTRQERRQVQNALAKEGFYQSVLDGAFGEGTRRAIARWQASRGEEASGYLNIAQFRALTLPPAAAAPQPAPTPEPAVAATVVEPNQDHPKIGKVYKKNFPRQLAAIHQLEAKRIDDSNVELALLIDFNGRRFTRSCVVSLSGPFTCTFTAGGWDPRTISGQLPDVSINGAGQVTRSSSVTLW